MKKPREFWIPVDQDYTGISKKFDSSWMDKEDYIHVHEVVPIDWDKVSNALLGCGYNCEYGAFEIIKDQINKQLMPLE